MSVLRIVATPIGNLEDITLRALRVLKESDFILCEDTRLSKRLLDRYDIKTPLISFHQHSGQMKIEKVITLLKEGHELALVTDAGTPGISDPGGKLIELVREHLGSEVLIESVPGPSAITTAISIAGSGFDRFLFLGFLPNRKGRQSKVKEIFASKYPVVLYESKHRIVKLMEELRAESIANGQNIKVSLARELTKINESFYCTNIDDILARFKEKPLSLKGEFVVLIQKEAKKDKHKDNNE